MARAVLILTVVSALAACGEHKSPTGRQKASPTPVSITRAPPRPSEPGAAVAALAPDQLQEAASVSQFHAMPRLNAKVFSVSGGDPAVNGLVTYLGLFVGPAEGWRIYPLGDFAAWRVVEAAPGRIVVETRQETVGPDGGVVKRAGHVHIDYDRKIEAPPAAITVGMTP